MQRPKIDSLKIIDKLYFNTFEAKDGNCYGSRLAQPYCSDVLFVTEIFKDIYGWNYLYPIVYDNELLNKSFQNENDLWFLAEDLDTKEIAGIGLVERRNPFSLEMGKLCIKKKFQGIGISSILGGHIIAYLMTIPESKSLLRFDCDVRANILFSQKFIENSRAKPYGRLSGGLF